MIGLREIESEVKLCPICMEYHSVATVEVEDEEAFKGEEVVFQAIYVYCSNIDEYLETEDMIRRNSRAMKDAYREKVGLLTSREIMAIREKYGVSQKDLAAILDWGRATITRYETHQVQDRAHDDVLRKIDRDPKWFLDMLERARPRLTDKAYASYVRKAKAHYRLDKNRYLVDTIGAIYATIDEQSYTGNVQLNLDKVVEMINYLASRVSSLHKVKLMKLLWYSDALHFKRTGKAISGLAYIAMSMGAVPEGHSHIMLLDGIVFDEVEYDDNTAYRFRVAPGFETRELTGSELAAMDTVIAELGGLNAQEISARMHAEEAYQRTERGKHISFELVKSLSIS